MSDAHQSNQLTTTGSPILKTMSLFLHNVGHYRYWKSWIRCMLYLILQPQGSTAKERTKSTNQVVRKRMTPQLVNWSMESTQMGRGTSSLFRVDPIPNGE
ncbi:hypothetical protein CY34DRAFT_797333 [Suillus luteus UH-Slu-Lm8-n1]|uniref:Uncharacterized protein n=1 Tax=Suillus luteus UH-Slu-Lm8-n1 TaxID=930992 RepID=A0A0D0AGW6_9AGAM|nr:hypothetical protein CY34DRAFT_797333 [Suillus luteus UH-Slu-Lm8-n1]